MIKTPAYLKLFSILCLGILCQTCVSIYDFDAEVTANEIVIFGKLTNSSIYDQAITVRRTSLRTTVGLSIEDAQVEVLDNLGNVYPYLFSEEEERFLPAVPFTGVPGVSYQARVIIGGKTYISTMQRMPTVGAQDSTYFQFLSKPAIGGAGIEFDQLYMQVLTDSRLDASEDNIYMKWDIEQVYIQTEMQLPAASFPFYSPRNCWIYDEFAAPSALLFDGDLVNSQLVQGQLVAEVVLDNSFKTLRGYGVIQSSFTREALDYWRRVDQISNRVGSIFEIPPAPIPGNFSSIEDTEDKPLGFFEVSKVDTTGTFVTAGDIPVFLGLNGDFINCSFAEGQFSGIPFNCFSCLEARGIPEGCYNCLSLPNSSLRSPSFLDD